MKLQSWLWGQNPWPLCGCFLRYLGPSHHNHPPLLCQAKTLAQLVEEAPICSSKESSEVLVFVPWSLFLLSRTGKLIFWIFLKEGRARLVRRPWVSLSFFSGTLIDLLSRQLTRTSGGCLTRTCGPWEGRCGRFYVLKKHEETNQKI